MSSSRLPALLALAVALFVGAAPWRVCSHAADGHVRVYLPGAHELMGHHDGHDHGHCDCDLEHRSPEHDEQGPCQDGPCRDGHCQHEDCGHEGSHDHDDDQRLLPGSSFSLVQVALPSLSGCLAWPAPTTAIRAGASEVAPSRAEEPPASSRCRAHEEDPVVLVR